MKFKDLQKEDATWLQYHSVIINMAYHHQVPFLAVQYDINENNQCIILFKEERGIVSTRKITCSKSDMVFVRSWLGQDFPDLELQIVERQQDIEELH